MRRVSTTIEQSNKLIELGVDVRTADLNYKKSGEKDEYVLDNTPFFILSSVGNIPAWSMASLLRMLPESINDGTDTYCNLKIVDHSIGYVYDDGKARIKFHGDSYMDNVYKLFVWLFEKKYIEFKDETKE